MKRSVLKLAVGIAVFTATSAITQAQTTATPPAAPEPTAYDKWEKEMKNPTDWFTWGADVRLRNEYGNNLVTLNEGAARHEQDYFRFRERIWASVMPVTNLSVNARFSGEQREWMKPSLTGANGNRSGLEERYGILDNAYAKWSNIGGVPLSLSAGRQDVQFGEPLNWWLVGDGTPGDGSWTFFLDSIRAAFDAKELKTKVDVVYIYQNARPDAWIPTLGRSGDNMPAAYNLTEQNEQGVILYLSNKSVKNLQIDGYFIYKRDNQEFANGDNADIYTLGAKISGTPATNWAYSVEGAYQFGSKQDATVGAAYVNSTTDWRDISAYGGNAKLTYLFKDKLDNQIGFVCEYLSGDDPNTKGTDEMFDILWGRWPRWSELYIYSYINETSRKIAQLNNIARFGPTWTCTPVKNTTFSAAYNAMFAPVDTPTRQQNSALFTDSGNFRGHYLQTVLKHKFNDHVSAHLWGEFVWMGNYYQQRDLMTFLRAEVLFTF
jgi:Alginate export